MVLAVLRRHGISGRLDDAAAIGGDDAGHQHHRGRVVLADVVDRTQPTGEEGQVEIFGKADDHQRGRAQGQHQKTKKDRQMQQAGSHVTWLLDLDQPQRDHLDQTLAPTVETGISSRQQQRRHTSFDDDAKGHQGDNRDQH